MLMKCLIFKDESLLSATNRIVLHLSGCRKIFPIWPLKQSYWTFEASWQNKAKFGFQTYICFEKYILDMEREKNLEFVE